MKKILLAFLSISLIIISLQSLSLKEVYDAAGPAEGYDKYLVLETGEVYTGGFLTGNVYGFVLSEYDYYEGQNVKIVGNGAIIDLQGEQISVSFCDKRLDIEDCIIINGTVRYRGDDTNDFDATPKGTTSHVTLYKPHDYGLRLQGAGAGVTLSNNVVYDVVGTGYGYTPFNGYSGVLLPTGTSISWSVQAYGLPFIMNNWTFHSNDNENIQGLTHYSRLCEYG